ncbi:hypothetical protein [Mongoliitalea daihaiensis]|uniref:hypothetical protein n=1 Tax=Mongoliitalea daihaiensis TaxID=2782006 RepID=UPI001F3B13D0|nr:hypothetical protein [Mongoliitalea daihaiensis]
MQKKFLIWIMLIALFSCETENPVIDIGKDYQPLSVGRFWLYEVEEIRVFGENDQEERFYFVRDIIDYTYVNAQNELVYVIKREESINRIAWTTVGNYAMFVRRNALIRFIDNQNTIPLVFPPRESVQWDANVFNAAERDFFTIVRAGLVQSGGIMYPRAILVEQEDEDDLITFRDKRYEVFAQGIGLVEQYSEVFTYCSRNDCLGEQLINGGRKSHMILVDYGRI